MIRDCKKLQNRNQRLSSAHIASFNEAFDQLVQFSVDELTRFYLYQESLMSPSTPVTTIAESGNPNTYLVSSSYSEWVIDSGATNHMTSNFSFDLVSVSKLTRALKCCVSFFPNFCLF